MRVTDAAFDTDESTHAFGLRIDATMMRVTARQLQAPQLRAGTERLTPRNGSWNYGRSTLCEGASLMAWCVVNFSSASRRDVDAFVNKIIQKASDADLVVDSRNLPPILHRSTSTEEALAEAVGRVHNRGGHVVFVLVILESKTSTRYKEVKRVANSVLGVVSQCVVADNRKMKAPAYVNNVVLQLNTKLGGVNSELRYPPAVLDSGATIVFGVSVEETRDGDAPVIAAVVAILDKYGSTFDGRVKKTGPDDLPSALALMMFELFVHFQQQHGAAPDKIVYFREGTNDGDIDHVFQAEVRAVHHAWLMGSTAAPPPMMFILVSRSHHVRAFPVRPTERSGNVPAGTVIDSVIVDPRRFDFYLYAHAGIIGTSRAAHYTVLLNDLHLDAVETEKLCFDLCHLVGRSTNSVSVVAPVTYAKDYVTKVQASTPPGARANGDIEVHPTLRDLPFFT